MLKTVARGLWAGPGLPHYRKPACLGVRASLSPGPRLPHPPAQLRQSPQELGQRRVHGWQPLPWWLRLRKPLGGSHTEHGGVLRSLKDLMDAFQSLSSSLSGLTGPQEMAPRRAAVQAGFRGHSLSLEAQRTNRG